MQIRKLVLTTMAVALASSACVGYAKEGRHGSDRHSRDHGAGQSGNVEQKVARIFNALDTNGDQIIVLDEWLVKTAEKAAKQFARIDADDDALISLEEFLAVHGRHGGRHGGGDNSDIDRDAVRACVAESLGTELTEHPDRETVFAEIDANDDGFIDIDEFQIAKSERATNKFNDIDSDADGGITAEELAASLTGQSERRSVRRECFEEQRDAAELLEG
jgi:Ca2+-binding EF-hand superfamily protein